MNLIAAIFDSALPGRLQPVALALARYADYKDGGRIFPSVERLARDLKVTGRAVQRQRAELIRLGVLIPLSSRKGGRGRTTLFRLDVTALPTSPAHATTPRRPPPVQPSATAGPPPCEGRGQPPPTYLPSQGSGPISLPRGGRGGVSQPCVSAGPVVVPRPVLAPLAVVPDRTAVATSDRTAVATETTTGASVFCSHCGQKNHDRASQQTMTRRSPDLPEISTYKRSPPYPPASGGANDVKALLESVARRPPTRDENALAKKCRQDRLRELRGQCGHTPCCDYEVHCLSKLVVERRVVELEARHRAVREEFEFRQQHKSPEFAWRHDLGTGQHQTLPAAFVASGVT